MAVDPFLKVQRINSNKKNINSKVTSSSNNNVKKIKRGKKLSLKTFLLGCGMFLFLFLIIGIGGLFYLAKNPQILLSGNNTNLEGAKQTLKIFGVIIFGILILVSFFLTTLSFMRLISNKTGRKKYLIGTIIGIILLLFSTFSGGFYYFLIKKIPSDYKIKNISLITSQVEINNGSIPLEKLRGFLFAPVYVDFYINTTKLDPAATDIKFNCGNGQGIIQWRKNMQRLKNLQLLGTCFFPKKGTYNIGYTVSYVKNGKKFSKQFGPFPFKIISQINIDINGQNNNTLRLNDQFKNSLNGQNIAIIGGNAPVKVIVDASDIFNNYPTLLADGRIGWDFDGNGKIDIENKEKVYFVYKKKGTYTLYVKIPQIGQIFKIATLIVNESDIPYCDLKINSLSNKKVKINLFLSNPTLKIKSLKGSIINTIDGSRAGTIKSISSTQLLGIVKNPGIYTIKLNIMLNNGKQIKCEKTFKIQKILSKIPVLIYLAKGEDENYSIFKKIFLERGKQLNINLPYKINFVKLLVSIPDNKDIANITLLDENKNFINQPEFGKFIFTIRNSSNYTLKINYTNGTTDSFKIKFNPKPPKISGKLKISPNCGFSPLRVILDATEIKLEDTNDEVIYYSWDFGDGQEFNNISQGKVTHEYKFDYEHNNGIFYPKVRIITKKGVTLMLTGKIIVKQAPRKINIISDPASQIVRIGEKITFYIQTNGQIKSIHWDFGNGNTYSCQGRQCASISTSYDKSGTYTVKAVVEFYNYPSEIATIKVKVVNDE